MKGEAGDREKIGDREKTGDKIEKNKKIMANIKTELTVTYLWRTVCAIHAMFFKRDFREAVKNYLADFAKKPLAERGLPPPPLNGQSPKKFLKKWVKKG